MIAAIQAFLRYPSVHGALIGWAIAAKADFEAFRTWHSFSDAKQYKWDLAVWNWLQGAVIGFVGGAGLNAML